MPTTRAKRACEFCNSRRIKCNAMESMPCCNCAAANVECRVTQSRRGRYARRPKTPKTPKSRISYMTNDIPTTEASSNHQDSQELQVPQAPQAPQYPQDPQDFRSRQDLLEQPGAQGPRDLHDTSLDQLAKPYQDNEVYLGESTLLRVVHNDHPPVGSYRSTKSHLRYPLPEVAAVPEWERQRKSRRLEALTAEGVLSSPDATVQNELFEAYFKWFHVCFPVVNKPATFRQSQAGELSPMLCNAMMFIGVIHSHPDELRKIGLGNREEARHLFYNRAKDLYDVDYESNSLVQLQTMFLLSFWRGGPLLQKDCRYWLGGAITLAQKKGMHRSFGNSDSMQARLRKRIWWSVYVRERQCAAALGLPNRIYDDDCDVDSLTVSDLDDSESLDAHTLLYSLEHVYYAIEMAKLTMFLGKIVHKEYMPNGDQSPLGRRQLKSELDNWHRQLPEVLGRGNDTGGLFVGMLHMAYNNILILLSRWAFIAGDQTGAEENSQTAYLAACRISRIAEDLLAENLIGHGQIHLITCLFNALCIHTVNLRRVEGTSRLVAEHRAKMCLYGLRELQKTWEVTNWVLQIFFQHLDRSMARRLQMIDQEEEDDTRSMAEKGPTISPPNHAPLAPVTGTNEPNETGVQIPVPPILESEFLKWGSMDDVGEFSLDALSNLDGITAVDLELLASCLT